MKINKKINKFTKWMVLTLAWSKEQHKSLEKEPR